jgi:hypothetical protein
MLVQPFDDASFERPALKLALWLAGRALLARPMTGERCYQIGFGLTDTLDKPSRDRGGTSPQNEPITGGLDRCPDHSKVVQQFASGIHISASAPAGTAPSTASGIGPIGLAGDGRAVPPSRSIL